MLEPLELTAALEMLDDLAHFNARLRGATEQERIDLCHETGGNPLLLRWTASQIGKGKVRSISHAIRHLRNNPEGNDPLEFVFGDLVRNFPPDTTKVLSALTYFSAPARVEHIAELTQLEAEVVKPSLDLLANSGVAAYQSETNAEEDRCAIVPAAAGFVHRVHPDVVSEIGAHLEAHAYNLILENGRRNFARFKVLEAQWPILAAALPLFLSGPSDRLHWVCRALRRFLDFTGKWDEKLSLNREAEVRAAKERDFLNAGWRAYDAGWVHNLRRQVDEVFACLTRVGEYWDKSDAGPTEVGYANRLRGLAFSQRKESEAEAIAAYRKSIEAFRRPPPASRQIAAVLSDLAEVEFLQGAFEAADKDLSEALSVATATDDEEGVTAYSGNLVEFVLMREEWIRAESLARESLTRSESLGRRELIALDSQRLARALIGQGKGAEAVEFLDRAISILEDLGSQEELETTRALLRKAKGT